MDETVKRYGELIQQYKYDFCRLVYLVFPFGEPGHELQHKAPYDWQMEEWARMSAWLQSPVTRYEPFKLNISSGNGAAKTSFMAMTCLMLMFAHQVRGRVTANTQPQMKSVTWPEFDVWFRHARYADVFFEKLGESIKSRDERLAETWRLDAVTWSENNPVAISGLHNAGKAVFLGFDEAAGIPSIIWKYASGAMTDVNTIKIWVAVGNSDDPDSQFEQNMKPDSGWFTRRIDTRTMKHVDPKQIAQWLREANGDEDHDDFRVRVRGLPRKSTKDSIMSFEIIKAALDRKVNLDELHAMPVILTCDPAWKGGDETVIAYRQGHYIKVLDKYKLTDGSNHSYTYNRLCYWEKILGADAVFIDQAEGTGIFSMAELAGKYHWRLISFAGSPYDKPDSKESQYGNLRAQMHYECRDWLNKGGILDAEQDSWREDIQRQLAWTKGDRHKTTLKKMAWSKDKIREEYGRSPDVSDAIVLCFADTVQDRLPENIVFGREDTQSFNHGPVMRNEEYDPLSVMDADFRDIT